MYRKTKKTLNRLGCIALTTATLSYFAAGTSSCIDENVSSYSGAGTIKGIVFCGIPTGVSFNYVEGYKTYNVSRWPYPKFDTKEEYASFLKENFTETGEAIFKNFDAVNWKKPPFFKEPIESFLISDQYKLSDDHKHEYQNNWDKIFEKLDRLFFYR